VTGWGVLLLLGILLVVVGIVLLFFLPERQGGTVKGFSIEVNAPGAGIVVIALGAGLAVVSAPHVSFPETAGVTATPTLPTGPPRRPSGQVWRAAAGRKQAHAGHHLQLA
jgi:uncharacterized membrane protein